MRENISGLLLASLGALVIFGGCGQTVYDERMNAAPDLINKRGPSTAGGGDAVAPNYFSLVSHDKKKIGIKFKLPVQFAGKEVPNVNFKNSGVKIPGLVGDVPICTLQTTFPDDSGKQVTASCYMVDVFKSVFNRKTLEDWIQDESSKLDSRANFRILNNSGQPPHSVIQVNSNLDFLVDGKKENRAGQLLIYSFETDLSIVFVCWLIENQSQQKAKLAETISKSMDTAALEPPEITAPPAQAPMK